MTLYDDLGVPKSATKAEIKRAYRQRSKKAHPDAGGKRESWDRIAIAYRVLGDDAARANYDATGKIDPDKPQDNSLFIVLSTIESILNTCATRGIDPVTVDIIADCKKTLQNKLREIAARKKEAESNLQKIKKIAKRFRVKKGKEDKIGPMLANRIAQIEQNMFVIEAEKPNLEAALAVLSDHEFNWDERGDWESNTNALTMGKLNAAINTFMSGV